MLVRQVERTGPGSMAVGQGSNVDPDDGVLDKNFVAADNLAAVSIRGECGGSFVNRSIPFSAGAARRSLLRLQPGLASSPPSSARTPSGVSITASNRGTSFLNTSVVPASAASTNSLPLARV